MTKNVVISIFYVLILIFIIGFSFALASLRDKTTAEFDIDDYAVRTHEVIEAERLVEKVINRRKELTLLKKTQELKREARRVMNVKNEIRRKNKAKEKPQPPTFYIVSTTTLTGMYQIEVKITNNSNKCITYCKAICILYDNNGNEIGVQSHYCIGTIFEGKLATGDSNYFTYVVNTNYPKSVDRVSFKIEEIKYE